MTEAPGSGVTREAASMLCTRYSRAAESCHGKDVLEVACGTGMGLGYLARRARRIIGGDYTELLLSRGQSHYRGRVPLVRLDAQALPFREASFDVVILFEAIYYLPRPRDFLNECCRVLRPAGVVWLCCANKEWEGFNPSPHCARYFSARELGELLRGFRFHVDVFGAFPASPRTPRQKLVAGIRKVAVRLHLIPKTMSGKEWLKKLFYGELVELGEELDDRMAGIEPLVPISPEEPATDYKVLYALGRRVSQP